MKTKIHVAFLHERSGITTHVCSDAEIYFAYTASSNNKYLASGAMSRPICLVASYTLICVTYDLQDARLRLSTFQKTGSFIQLYRKTTPLFQQRPFFR